MQVRRAFSEPTSLPRNPCSWDSDAASWKSNRRFRRSSGWIHQKIGLKLSEVSSRALGAIFERMRNILHEASIDKRTQYMIEVLFAIRKDGFSVSFISTVFLSTIYCRQDRDLIEKYSSQISNLTFLTDQGLFSKRWLTSRQNWYKWSTIRYSAYLFK